MQLCIYPSIHTFIYPSIHQSVHHPSIVQSSICSSIYPLIHSFNIHSSICPSIYQSTHPSLRPFTFCHYLCYLRSWFESGLSKLGDNSQQHLDQQRRRLHFLLLVNKHPQFIFAFGTLEDSFWGMNACFEDWDVPVMLCSDVSLSCENGINSESRVSSHTHTHVHVHKPPFISWCHMNCVTFQGLHCVLVTFVGLECCFVALFF